MALIDNKSALAKRRGLRARLADCSGETLVETLIAFMVVVMAVTMLAIAVFTSARVNAAIEPKETLFNKDTSDPTGLVAAVSLVHTDGNSVALDVTAYKTDEGYIYYVGD